MHINTCMHIQRPICDTLRLLVDVLIIGDKYIHACILICMHVCELIHTRIVVHIFSLSLSLSHTHIYIYITSNLEHSKKASRRLTNICTYAYWYIHMHLGTHTHTHVCTLIHTYASWYIHTHTNTQRPICYTLRKPADVLICLFPTQACTHKSTHTSTDFEKTIMWPYSYIQHICLFGSPCSMPVTPHPKHIHTQTPYKITMHIHIHAYIHTYIHTYATRKAYLFIRVAMKHAFHWIKKYAYSGRHEACLPPNK